MDPSEGNNLMEMLADMVIDQAKDNPEMEKDADMYRLLRKLKAHKAMGTIMQDASEDIEGRGNLPMILSVLRSISVGQDPKEEFEKAVIEAEKLL